MMKITVFLPAYNEGENIPILIPKINNALKKLKKKNEIILVNDGSTDDTGKIAEELKGEYPQLRIFHHKTNKGISEAFNTAFKHVTGDVIVFLPTDLQSNPEEDLPKLLNKLEEGFDLVCGFREQWDRPKSKITQSRIYSYMSRKLFGVNIHDFNWVRAFKKEVITELRLRKDWHRYFVVMVAAKGYNVGEVKVREYPRKTGKSKFNILRVFTGFIDLLIVKFYLSFSEKPMLLFSVPGITLFTFSFLIGLYSFILWYTQRIGDKYMLYFLMVMCAAVGIQLFAIGILAEFMAIIREEIKRK